MIISIFAPRAKMRQHAIHCWKRRKMKVCFLRHAQATHNAAALEHGECAYESWEYQDALLTPHGHAQAAAIQLPFKPDRVYSSPLRRCIQTARAAAPSAIIHLYDGLIERQGQHPCNVRADKHFISAFDSSLNSDTLNDVYVHPFHHRETDEEVRVRATSALTRIYEDAAHAGASQILVVTHWDVLKVLFDVDVKNAHTHVVGF